MSNPRETQKLAASALIFYALPALPLALLSGPALASLPNFYAADIGLPLAAVGIALMLARLWDTLADPLVGILSDRTQSRFGRRKPWMIAGVPLMLLGAWFALARPHVLTPLTLTLASILMYSGWTMIKLSHDAWGAELSGNYAERVRITAWREGAALVGALVAILLIGWGLSKRGQGLTAAYGMIFILLAISMTLCVALASRFVPAIPAAGAAPILSWAVLRDAWQANPALRILSGAYLVNTLATALPATLFQAFVIHALLRADLQGPLILLYSMTAIVAVPAWSHASRRFGKHVAWRASMLANALFFIPVIMMREPQAIWFALICVCTGVCLAADLVLPPAIQADVLDEDRLASGADRAGLLFAWLGLLGKLGYALAPGIAFPLLAATGFSSSPGSANSAEAIWMLAGLYALAPVALKLLAWRMMRHFPLDAPRQHFLQMALKGQKS